MKDDMSHCTRLSRPWSPGGRGARPEGKDRCWLFFVVYLFWNVKVRFLGYGFREVAQALPHASCLMPHASWAENNSRHAFVRWDKEGTEDRI